MADYYLQFSCELDVGAENARGALALYQTMADELEAEEGVGIGFEVEASDGHPASLWIHDDGGCGEPEQVIAFVLRCAEAFDLKGRWGFCWALTCSRPRLDAFGGGAQVFDLGTRKSLDWVDCANWLALQLQADPAEDAPGG
ncbi:MAG: hypothetical protein JO127_07150 [Caulobacteraceae bacterium]|nr:hypothetical protein [Caulobacteraceae bacterium]